MQSEDGYAALIIAAQNLHSDIKNIEEKQMPMSICSGHSEIVIYLIEANADINMNNRGCCTAVIIAAKNKHSGMAKQLIETSSNI